MNHMKYLLTAALLLILSSCTPAARVTLYRTSVVQVEGPPVYIGRWTQRPEGWTADPMYTFLDSVFQFSDQGFRVVHDSTVVRIKKPVK